MNGQNRLLLSIILILPLLILNIEATNQTSNNTNFLTLNPGLHNLSIIMNDYQNIYQPGIEVERFYTINLPTGFNSSLNNSYDLLLNFHGIGGVAYSISINSGFTSLSNENEFIVIYPQSMGVQTSESGGIYNIFDNDTSIGNRNTCWNVETNHTTRDTCYGTRINPDDDKFIDIIINNLTTQINISRIFASGFSNGCSMAQHTAEIRLDISGVAVGGCRVHGLDFMNYNESVFNESRMPFPILRIHATNDTTVPYQYLNHTLNDTNLLPTAELATYYYTLTNKCSPNATIEYNMSFENLYGVSQVDHWIYENCTNDASVEFYKLQDGRHRWYSNFASTFWEFLDTYGAYILIQEVEQSEIPPEIQNPPSSSSGGGGSSSSNNNIQNIVIVNTTEENITEKSNEIILENFENSTFEENITKKGIFGMITGSVIGNLSENKNISISILVILILICFYFIGKKHFYNQK